MNFPLTPAETKEVRYLAALRNRKETIFGVSTYSSAYSALRAHEVGLAGEMAWCRFLGATIDSRCLPRGDDGNDIVLHGATMAVKTTTYTADPWLRVEDEHCSASLYLLASAHPDLTCVRLIGWTTRAGVLRARRKRLTRNGPTNYIVGRVDLLPPGLLLAFLLMR